MHHDEFSEFLAEILSHITNGARYNIDEVESYLVQKNPEWHALLDDPEGRIAIIDYLKYKDTSKLPKSVPVTFSEIRKQSKQHKKKRSEDLQLLWWS